ncbi:MAG: UDP-N-acetylmuramoyl-L-alanyl-D-glutamate--2,6-diaminopimelate ligase, partial [Armatimonadetes bacterium]|nr:UDP-N-acetylmuramoyl-L-alanyl-D-glutamate--2,6-diaminopimelate ligase [Armatimonadota bacterium]
EELPGDRTTPESPELQSLLHQMAQADRGTGMVVAIEVSSHALAQDRTLGAEFDVGVFTNLTQDHLDYHGSMEEYFRAKRRLFTQYPEESTKPFHAIVNRDDPYGRRLEQEAAGIVWSYGVESEALLQAWNIQATASGLAYTLRTPDGEAPIRLALGGLFNVANSLAAAGAARALGLSWETIRLGLEAAPAAPGRFESVNEGQEFGVLVDYAHTPDGLLNVLESARALQPRRLLVVFGCGGDRDRTKRPIMAGIAARLADHAIITSDNPRTEDPTAIVQEIAAGLTPEAPHDVIVDRRAAIRHAIQSAGPGDLVVIAGKGHETYQIFADGTIHFDDREEARAALRARRSG